MSLASLVRRQFRYQGTETKAIAAALPPLPRANRVA